MVKRTEKEKYFLTKRNKSIINAPDFNEKKSGAACKKQLKNFHHLLKRLANGETFEQIAKGSDVECIGNEVDEDDAFCKACGNSLIEENKEYIEKNNNTPQHTTKNQEDKLLIVPIILGIIGIAIGIMEGLSCPMLFGWDSILVEILISIIGGCAGLYLYKYKCKKFICF